MPSDQPPNPPETLRSLHLTNSAPRLQRRGMAASIAILASPSSQLLLTDQSKFQAGSCLNLRKSLTGRSCDVAVKEENIFPILKCSMRGLRLCAQNQIDS